jgi:hypothetical protein
MRPPRRCAAECFVDSHRGRAVTDDHAINARLAGITQQLDLEHLLDPSRVIGFHPGHHITGDAAGGVDDGDAHAFIAPARDSHEAPVSDRERRYVHTAADHGGFE